MKKKRIAIFCTILVVLGAVNARLYYVNANVKVPVKQFYNKGEIVLIKNDFNETINDASTGYTVQVLNSNILSTEDLCNKYNVEKTVLNKSAEHYYLVEVSIGNTNTTLTEGKGIAMDYFALVGTNYYMMIDRNVYKALNPKMPGSSFSLRPNSSMKVILPYDIVPSVHSSIENIMEDKPKLQLTAYPHRKMISLTEE